MLQGFYGIGEPLIYAWTEVFGLAWGCGCVWLYCYSVVIVIVVNSFLIVIVIITFNLISSAKITVFNFLAVPLLNMAFKSNVIKLKYSFIAYST